MSGSTKRAALIDPRRYFEHIAAERGPLAEVEPVCLYLETTNRCNLLCTTCPRTFEALEPPADMSWELFTRIVDQFPRIARVVLHGVGEPMMVPALPRMIRYLKDRGTYVLFNTNGTLLTRRKGRELIDSGLDELRVSLDAAEPDAFKLVRGRDMFGRIVRNVRGFPGDAARAGRRAAARVAVADRPQGDGRRSLATSCGWRTTSTSPRSICSGSSISPRDRAWRGRNRPCSPDGDDEEGRLVREAETLARSLGISFNASGATDPASSLDARRRRHSPGRSAGGRGR